MSAHAMQEDKALDIRDMTLIEPRNMVQWSYDSGINMLAQLSSQLKFQSTPPTSRLAKIFK